MSKTFYYFQDGDFPINVTEETVAVTPYTFQSNCEMWETKSLKQFFSQVPTDKFVNIVDIGAQSGLYSLFAKYLPRATFFAFEPFPQTFKLLNDNIALNNLNNVIPQNIAISDKVGEATLNICKSHNGLHTLGENPLRFSDIDRLTVKTSTLDNLFWERGIPVHFIKIDTEGGEYRILKGAIETLRNYKPVIQLEWNITNMKQANVSENMLNDLLSSLGYNCIGFVEEEKLFVAA